MRIAVVGATGNTGTALLEELASRDEVSSILGIARRMPDDDAAPYHHAEWATADIQFPEAEDKLTEAFRGVDGVVHLAWLIQPNSKRELLRRTNVDGTRHVLEAAAAAGVKHIAVASSVGAYSPAPDQVLHDESWPIGGIPGSHYSADKAAQERVCDEFETEHPEISLARIRPGLIFQGGAGAEIQRYFAGTWAPVQVLQKVRPGAVPLPADIRAQAVHARDVAAAYAEAVIRGARGGFNICADDVLDAEAIASAVAGDNHRGRLLPLPLEPLRSLVKAANRAHLLPMDEGWLDMAAQVPLMDNSRAKAELGWQPTMTGVQALKELINGMSEGAGSGSIPLRPRKAAVTLDESSLPAEDHALPEHVDEQLLRQYLADHLSGATAGMQRIIAMSEDFVDTPVFPQLAEVAETIRAEHAYLAELINRQGFTRPAVMAPLAWAGERAARLKPYATPPWKRSPSALVLEAELMQGAVTAKRQGWKVLAEHARDLGVPRGVFEELADAATEQLESLEEVHSYARGRAFRTTETTFVPGQ